MSMNNIRNYILPTTLVILFSVLISAGYYFTRTQEDDGVRINLSGRQRMLSQKITKELLMYKIGVTNTENIKRSMKIFEETENALLFGGIVNVELSSENYRTIPQINDRICLDKLTEIKKEWEPFAENINKYILSPDDESLKYILSHNETMLSKIDEAVYSLQLRSEKNILITRLIIICSFLMISALLLINLIKRIKELRNAADRIKNLETLLPICSSCKKIRTDNVKPLESESWTTIEEYLRDKNDMLFTHSICPDCIKKLYPGMLEQMKK